MMKLLYVCACVFAAYNNGYGQQVIVTSLCSTATANHNQRKIVRYLDETLTVFYQDREGDTSVIRAVGNNNAEETWGAPERLFNGRNPAAAVSFRDTVHLVFEGNDSAGTIIYACKTDTGWLDTVVLGHEGRLPTIDVDGSGNVHVLWITDEAGDDGMRYMLLSNGAVMADTVLRMAAEDVYDAMVVNNLGYGDDDAYIAYAYQDGSRKSYVNCIVSRDSGTTWMALDTLCYDADRIGFPFEGTCPNLAVGIDDVGTPYPSPTFIYLDTAYDIEVVLLESGFLEGEFGIIRNDILRQGPASDLIIDNPLVAYGFSFVYLKEGVLCHDTENGSYVLTGERIGTSPAHPTMTYKHFNTGFIDVVWMEPGAGSYELVWQRMEKRYQDISQFNGMRASAIVPRAGRWYSFSGTRSHPGGVRPGVYLYQDAAGAVSKFIILE